MSFLASPTTRVTSRILPEGAPAPRYGRFAISFDCPAGNFVTVDIRTNAHFISQCVAFESVELLECELSFVGPATADSSDEILAGFVPSGTSSTDAVKHAIVDRTFSAPTVVPRLLVQLPPDHNFGRELKATVLGNSAPVAFVIAYKKASGKALLRFRACFHGSALG